MGVFTCKFHGKEYGELDVFDSGINGCAKCICVDTQVYCNTTRCPGNSTESPTTIPTFPPNPTTETNFEIDNLNGSNPKQDVENVNAISSEELSYKPYQIGSGSVYRNRAHVYIQQLGSIDTQKQIKCSNGSCEDNA